jgi:alanine-glyoxylate transaminase/serine-glyoxylate transaminase/serine-pyruvate transaminase
MPEHLFFALREALDIIQEQGMPAIFRRHRRLAGAVHRAVEVWSEGGALSFNALVPEQRSVSVTAIRTGASIDANRLRTHAREALGVSVAGGLGALQGQAFRIGHLGDLNEPMILGCLAGLELAFIELGIPHGANGVRAAAEYLARERTAATSNGGVAPRAARSPAAVHEQA